MYESEKWKWSRSVLSNSSQFHGLPGSSVHGIFQERVLEWGAIAFSDTDKQAFTKEYLGMIGSLA